ncbi:MAG: DUF4393 domain-containing protein [Nitriliruptorales bacterium]|nr:DUF4393 domain-containing protein [Nitriliruptorales bacterium]
MIEENDMAGDALRATFEVLRVGAEVGTKIATFGLRSSAQLTGRVVSGVRRGDPASDVLAEALADVRVQARNLFGLAPEPARRAHEKLDAATLRRKGEELLRRSVDIEYEEPFHPSYARILDLLAPDEARILRYLTLNGAEPAVDVRAVALGARGEMLAPGISLIGERAGVRFPDRVPAYLNNLFRLGLIWFSREELDAKRYEMLEAQPPVQDALKQAKRTRTVRRSIELTPFGRDFSEVCLPTDDVI